MAIQWKISSVYGTRVARNWPMALKYIQQDMEKIAVQYGKTAKEAEQFAADEVREFCEAREPFRCFAGKQVFSIEKMKQ